MLIPKWEYNKSIYLRQRGIVSQLDDHVKEHPTRPQEENSNMNSKNSTIARDKGECPIFHSRIECIGIAPYAPQ